MEGGGCAARGEEPCWESTEGSAPTAIIFVQGKKRCPGARKKNGSGKELSIHGDINRKEVEGNVGGLKVTFGK